MKNVCFFILLLLFSCSETDEKPVQEEGQTSGVATSFQLREVPFDNAQPKMVQIEGYPGAIINNCLKHRIQTQDIDHLIEPFTKKDETWAWQSEFWGKWMLSAVAAYQYKPDAELLATMNYAVNGLLETQLPNGYIGNYGPEHQLTAWDIWGRKYSMLGLIRYFEVTDEKKALDGAAKVADHLISQVGPEKVNIIETGNYRGMASSSVLEPIVYLYNHTQNEKYLEFAQYIVRQWETEKGPKLINKALAGETVSERFPHPSKWWSWENGGKDYEMMSCYEGLLELYKITKQEEYLRAVIATVDDIIHSEINIAGSGSAFECWYEGVKNQTQPTYHTMETCVTITWMKLCKNLLRITGDPKYADQIERSFYNALMASMKYDASQIAKYSPLEGIRHEGEEQCGMHINCCNANGPRGFTLMPTFALMQAGKEIYINYYGESRMKIKLPSGNALEVNQSTSYPVTGSIRLNLELEQKVEFDLFLRIPVWSKQTVISVNGQFMQDIVSGTYFKISREWKSGDSIEIKFDMRGQLIRQDDHQAILRGPIVLARDTRFGDGYVDETAIIQAKDGWVDLQPLSNTPDHIWMAFTAPAKIGTDLEGDFKEPRPIKFCDFASAGNIWEPSARYRVWIRETLNVQNVEQPTIY